MQDIEPFYKWRDQYIASEDPRSPYFGQQYSEFHYSHAIYNYYIHPQWDEMDSDTLYLKILYVDYIEGFAIIEFIGEWNDAIQNDIMYLKRSIIEKMMKHEIYRFVLILDNVLNFHSSDDCYYEEWHEEVSEESGWIVMLGVMDHIEEELKQSGIQYYVRFGAALNEIDWRRLEPGNVVNLVEYFLHTQKKRLRH